MRSIDSLRFSASQTTKINAPPETARTGGQRRFLPRTPGLAGPLHFDGYAFQMIFSSYSWNFFIFSNKGPSPMNFKLTMDVKTACSASVT
jgi:hypothetical protein